MNAKFLEDFHLFVEHALVPIVGVNENCIIQSFNKAAEELFGWAKSEAIGNRFSKIFSESTYQDTVEKEIRNILNKKLDFSNSRTFEIVSKHRDGRLIPALISVIPFRLENYTIIYLFIKDVAKQKQSMQEIQRSEQMYRQMIEGIRDYAIFMLDRSGIIVSWNRGAQLIKGYRSEEIIGKHFSTFYLKEDLEVGKPQFELKVAMEDGKFEEENWRVRKDGTLFWANVLITSIWDDDGKLQGFAKITRDLTSKRQTEEALKQIQERYYKLIENLQDYAIFTLDIKGRVSAWNKGAEKVTGYTTEEIIGESFSIFFSKKNKENDLTEKILLEAKEQKQSEKEVFLVRKDKSEFHADVIVNPIYHEISKLFNFAVIVRDLSHVKKTKSK